ncbi:MAG: hypothetical protein JWR80_8907 [Bradyrhizobium sp.]|nr:hypothetical protein [Bradyrhizobium sp.]
MPSLKDQMPRIFQVNVARLFQRVILPGLEALPLHASLEQGEAATLDEFLDRAAAQVDNYTANEAAKAYTLTLAAAFERQLSIWARAIPPSASTGMPPRRGFADLLSACAEHAGIDLESGTMGADLAQMFAAANVVRHGEGTSAERLHISAPMLWADGAADYQDLMGGPPMPSEQLRIRKRDLVRYVRAITLFWGLADPLPMAVTDLPYRDDEEGAA